MAIRENLDSLDDKKAEELLKKKKQEIMRRRRQTYEESILIKNLQMIHSSYQAKEGGSISTDNQEIIGGRIHVVPTGGDGLEDGATLLEETSLVQGMFPTGIPPRPQREIIEEIKVMKILEKQKSGKSGHDDGNDTNQNDDDYALMEEEERQAFRDQIKEKEQALIH